jgi:hypothetical protein
LDIFTIFTLSLPLIKVSSEILRADIFQFFLHQTTRQIGHHSGLHTLEPVALDAQGCGWF